MRNLKKQKKERAIGGQILTDENQKKNTSDNKNINEAGKRGGFIGIQREVLSIYIRAREREAHFKPALFPASLIFQPLCGILGNDKTMDRYKETFETWNKVASLYQDKFMDLDLYNDTYDFICNSIAKDNAKVLEIGCGPGNITKYLLSKRPDFDIFGIDIAPNMIELAKKNNPTASFTIMDSRQISDLNTKYDGIVCGFCLPYLSQPDSKKFISDCYNLLNENGHLYLSFVEGDPNKSDFQVGSSGDRTYFYFYNLDDLTEQLKKNNFEQIKVFKVDYKKAENEYDTHTILTAKRKTTA